MKDYSKDFYCLWYILDGSIVDELVPRSMKNDFAHTYSKEFGACVIGEILSIENGSVFINYNLPREVWLNGKFERYEGRVGNETS